MRYGSRVAALAVAAAGGCSPRLTVPGDAVIGCADSAACPEGWICDPFLGRCVVAGPATVSVGTVARSIGEVEIPVSLRASDGGQATATAVLLWEDDRYDIDVDVRLGEAGAGGGGSSSGVIGAGAGASAGVNAGADGGSGGSVGAAPPAALLWDAPAFFAAHGRPGSPLVQDLVVEITPADGGGPGPPVRSERFAFGNDPPVISDLEVQNVVAGIAAGDVVISFQITDSSDDQIDLGDLEVVLDEAASDDVALDVAADIDAIGQPLAEATDRGLEAAGALDEEPQSEGGVTLQQALVWDSLPAVPGREERVSLRFTVLDSYGGVSAAAVSSTFVIDNAPRLRVQLVAGEGGARPLDLASVSVTVADPNPGQTVDLALGYAVGGDGVWRPGSLAGPGLVSPLGLLAPPVGATYRLTWDPAAGDLGAALPVRNVDSNGDGVADRSVLAFAPLVRVGVRATDSAGAESTEWSEPFRLGNDPPEVTLTDPAAVFAGPLHGAIPLQLRVADSASDDCSLEMELRADEAQAWRRAAVVLGSLTGVATRPEGAVHVVVWDSAAPPAADPALPQGLGAANVAAPQLRVRAYDRPDGVLPHYGAWAEVVLPPVENP